MKKSRVFCGCILFILALIPFQYRAQSNFGCDLFCVTNVTLNTTESLWYVDIAFEGGMSDFINYPYVGSMVNLAGETVAVGSMEYFGQFGGTTTTYHPAMNNNDLGFEGTVYFVYDQDTCALSYPCLTSAVTEKENFVMVQSDNEIKWIGAKPMASIVLFDLSGKMVASVSSANEISIAHLSSGVYIFQCQHQERMQRGKIWNR
ncbi:MAG: hypothetical protein RLY35_845 [Bacteroidota bacterium]